MEALIIIFAIAVGVIALSVLTLLFIPKERYRVSQLAKPLGLSLLPLLVIAGFVYLYTNDFNLFDAYADDLYSEANKRSFAPSITFIFPLIGHFLLSVFNFLLKAALILGVIPATILVGVLLYPELGRIAGLVHVALTYIVGGIGRGVREVVFFFAKPRRAIAEVHAAIERRRDDASAAAQRIKRVVEREAQRAETAHRWRPNIKIRASAHHFNMLAEYYESLSRLANATHDHLKTMRKKKP